MLCRGGGGVWRRGGGHEGLEVVDHEVGVVWVGGGSVEVVWGRANGFDVGGAHVQGVYSPVGQSEVEEHQGGGGELDAHGGGCWGDYGW